MRYDMFARHQRGMDDALDSIKQRLYERRDRCHQEESECLARVIEAGIANGNLRAVEADVTARSMVLATNSLMPYALSPQQLGDRETVLQRAEELALVLCLAVEPLSPRTLQ